MAETNQRDQELTREIEIILCSVRNNRSAALRGVRDCTIARQDRVMVITIKIGCETVIIRVPP